MSARVAGGWALGLGLLAVLPMSGARGEEAGFDLPLPPAAPAFVEIGPATTAPLLQDPERTSAVVDRLALPEQPEVTVEVPAAETPKGAVAAEANPLAVAIEARLADPKLPLPPKVSARARESLTSYYAGAGHRPLWLADGAWTDAARTVIDRLGRAGEDGLDPADYPIPSLAAGSTAPGPTDLAEAELKLSATAFLYARDARGGRLDPSRISALITPKLNLPTPADLLAALAGQTDPGTVLEGFNPRYPGYRALKAKLAEIRAERPSGPMVRVPSAGGPRIASAGEPGGLKLPRVAPPRLEGDILANMERWRWLPSEVPNRYLAVNIPEFRVRLMTGGRIVHETRVITGKPVTPTPVFSGVMEYAIVNPSWFIPPSILKKEILPGLAGDPDYAAKRGYAVVRRGKSVSVRQPPGPRNALGYVKYMFPNNHAVYLHDTPNRNLFGSSQRAFSHGCVRVEQPFALGGQIIGGTWTEARLKSLIGHGERQIMLAEKLPISLTYFTLSVDEFGSVRTFDDIYGYNRRVRAALGLGA